MDTESIAHNPANVYVHVHGSGPALWPDRYDEPALEKIRSVLGPKHFNALYQQNPVDDEGAMFPRSAWQWYTPGSEPQMREIIISVDSAFKEGVGSDYSVFAVWGHDGLNSYYLLDLWRNRVEFPDLILRGNAMFADWQQRATTRKVSLVVEDKASGQSAIQVWRRPQWIEGGKRVPALTVQPFKIPAGMSKEARADGITHLVRAGRVYLPHSRPWTADFVQEHVEFPLGAHDDMCFPAGTMIATPRGDIPIERIQAGDVVLTPGGSRVVTAAGCTGTRATIQRHGLRATGNHPVFVPELGFLPLADITPGMPLERLTLRRMLTWTYLKSLSFEGSNIGSWERADITLASQRVMQGGSVPRDCMWRFGRLITVGRYREAMRFITGIATRSTTTLAIWSAYRGRNIAQRAWCTATQISNWNTLKPSVRSLRHGTALRKVWSGTDKTQSELGRNAKSGFKSVRSVEVSSSHFAQRDSATSAAETSIARFTGYQRTIRQRASCVAQALKRLVAKVIHGEATLVAASVVRPCETSVNRQLEPVYNLSVEGAGCYYADSTLVSNCDSTSQALAYFIGQPKRGLATF